MRNLVAAVGLAVLLLLGLTPGRATAADANVTYTITNAGKDVGSKAYIQYFPAGQRDSQTADANSGDTRRLPPGSYDVHVRFDEGLVHKELWLTSQAFSGTVRKTVDLGLVFARPTVTVTWGAASVGDKAEVTYFDLPASKAMGSVQSAQPAVVEAATYDIRARMDGAEAWLRHVAVSGEPHLTIELQQPKPAVPVAAGQVAAGAAGAAATAAASNLVIKHCSVEVYGVNFDFDKATLRPDSEPVLNQVLVLFQRDPDFAAEIGGHTDNIGTRRYNLDLSARRAVTVKAWLVAHGVAAARLTTAGYADTRPLVPNTSDENRFRNRRVELQRRACKE